MVKWHKKATPIRLKEWHTKYEQCKYNKKTHLFRGGNYEPTTILIRLEAELYLNYLLSYNPSSIVAYTKLHFWQQSLPRYPLGKGYAAFRELIFQDASFPLVLDQDISFRRYQPFHRLSHDQVSYVQS